MRNWWQNQYVFDEILFICKNCTQHLVSLSILRTNNRKRLPVSKQTFQTALYAAATTALILLYTQLLPWDKINCFSGVEIWAETRVWSRIHIGPCPCTGTTYARSQLFRLFYHAKDEPSWLHTPSQLFGSHPNTCIPALSPYKYISPTSFWTATSFTCTFGKTQYTPKRKPRNSSRFKTATFMPWTLPTGILTSSKSRRQMIHQRLFSCKMTRDTCSTSRNWKKSWGYEDGI